MAKPCSHQLFDIWGLHRNGLQWTRGRLASLSKKTLVTSCWQGDDQHMTFEFGVTIEVAMSFVSGNKGKSTRAK